MRIDDRQPTAACNVLLGQGLKRRRLTGTTATDQVHVKEPVGLPNSKSPVRRPVVRCSEIGNGIHRITVALQWIGSTGRERATRGTFSTRGKDEPARNDEVGCSFERSIRHGCNR